MNYSIVQTFDKFYYHIRDINIHSFNNSFQIAVVGSNGLEVYRYKQKHYHSDLESLYLTNVEYSSSGKFLALVNFSKFLFFFFKYHLPKFRLH